MITIMGLAAWEEQRTVHVPSGLVFLGNASFAIYLVHGIVLPVATKGMMFLNVGAFVPPLVGLFILVILSVLAGCLAHVFLERPIIRALRPMKLGTKRL